MALITLPTKFEFSRVNSFKLQRATNILRSKYTAQSQRIIYPFAIWMLDAELREYDGVDAGRIRSFLAQLEGQKNTFRLPVPGYTKPNTTFDALNTALTVYTTAAVRATSMVVATAPVRASTPLFADGDFFTVNDELKMVIGAVSTDVNGRATVNFQAALRAQALATTSVVANNPWALMTAADDDVANWGIAPPVRQSSRFAAVEAV